MNKSERIIARLEEDRIAIERAMFQIETCESLISVQEYDRAGELFYATKRTLKEQLSKPF